ncbi:MAG: hypothetical protein HY645_14635 [Acidobacteria bacterium]|nr:hypothetical protein [Acidobacteriota bacterium]
MSSLELTVPPLGSTTIATEQAGTLASGSSRVTADGVIAGIIRFTIAAIGTAGVGASQPLSAFLVPVRKTGVTNTGIAIRNTESKAVVLNLTLRNNQGEVVTNGTRIISNFSGGAHLAQFIDQLFQTASTTDFEGTLVVQVTGGKVAAIALELGNSAGSLTTLPVIELSD